MGQKRYTITINVDVDEAADLGPALKAACDEVGEQERAGVRQGSDPRTRVTWATVGPNDPPPT